jgi:hypothetical protein
MGTGILEGKQLIYMHGRGSLLSEKCAAGECMYRVNLKLKTEKGIYFKVELVKRVRA